MLVQQLVNGLTLGLLYALIAVGYTMVYGVIGLINFAHGEVFMLGAFLCVSALGIGLPLALACALSVGACAAIGIAIDAVAYRPLRAAPRLAALITAIGMSIFLQNLALVIWGSRPRPFVREALPAFFGQTAFELYAVRVNGLQVVICLVSLALMAGLHLFIRRTRAGAAMRALAQNRVCARLMGVSVNRVISLTFALGSGLGAAAGVLTAIQYNSLTPTMGYNAGVKAFAAAVLGGVGSVPGAMLGGVILGVAETLGAGYVSSTYRDGVAYAVLIAVIVLRPAGLLGQNGAAGRDKA
ncbi:MAG: branched-chain amino acid ABC transporter permease [Desulfovibrionaceae bacterium]|nr:branched-chain amino acid ABC transporter permease [Desulfovibrionaceae bacterium]MBF0512761.1 branched-chain amino acid ABC transporter permease [Desulfovibrionaceae bacterium]